MYILGKSREAHLPIYGICTAFLAREAALFYRLLGILGKDKNEKNPILQ
jgi:hypothetical protein